MSTKTKRALDIVFKRNSNIGAADAESDKAFLNLCFIDSGELSILKDCSNPKRIIVGRTGSGKSALLQRLIKTEQNAIVLSPENLALNYISNSTIIEFFESIGVKLEPFYSLLWQHVIVVELLKKKYNIDSADKMQKFRNGINYLLERSPARKKALEYIENWGTKFWEETSTRVNQITQKFEADLEASAGINFASQIKAGVKAAEKLSEETKSELVHRAQNIINNVQMHALSEMVSLLADEIFNNDQQKFFIVIDQLDEQWADNSVRYHLIKALLETVRKFQRIPAVKLILAMRSDLLEKVLKMTANDGFQSEKYKSLYLNLRWTPAQLEELLDMRVRHLLKSQYTKDNVGIRNILPQLHKKDVIEYILERTFMRPREAILFINECIEEADGKTVITEQMMRVAERKYSQQRILALEEEWGANYPRISDYIKLFERRQARFKLADLNKSELDDFFINFLSDDKYCETDPIYIKTINAFNNGKLDSFDIVKEVISVLYKVGFIGIRVDGYTETYWSFKEVPTIETHKFNQNTRFDIHPTFWMTIGIQPVN